MKPVLMFLSLILALIVLSPLAQADNRSILSCRVAKIIDENVYAEGLSKHEYPNVRVDRVYNGLEMQVGVFNPTNSAKGDIVRVDQRGDKMTAFSLRKGSNRRELIKTSGLVRDRAGKFWGTLQVSEGRAAYRDVALLICSQNDL